MRGKYKVIIQNKKIKYEFEIRRNISVVRGDSATGKTTLVDMVREYYEIGVDSGITLNSEAECAVLEGRNWKIQLRTIKSSIIFIPASNEPSSHACMDIWRLPRGSNTPLLCSVASWIPRCLQRGL